VCFTNNVASLPASVASFEWDYGDGSTNTTDWDGECHNYTADGTYTVTLKVVLTNGCENEYSAKFGIKIEKFEPDVNRLTDTVLCMGQNLVLSNSIIGGASYKWELYDADKKLIGVVGTGIVQNIRSNEPDDFYVKLTITKGNCDKESRFIKYSAVGVVADFIPLNAVQCVSQDTVYTLNLTKKYPTAKPSYFWDFGDGKAANCFGYKQNCNRDSNENSQHFYMDTGCMKIELYVIDRATGCTSTANKEVSFVKPEDAIFSPNGDGMNEEFFFEIENERMYHLLVYNRYGERVFDTKQPQVGWNGRHQNQGKELPDGTYFYVLKYGYHCEKEDRLAKGIVEIVR
jgi:gliding motility-associated-like protein